MPEIGQLRFAARRLSYTAARRDRSSTDACRSSAPRRGNSPSDSPGIVRRRSGRRALRSETLLARPRLEQRAVDREVLVRQQARGLRLRQHFAQRTPCAMSPSEQPVAILRERRRHPRSDRPCSGRRTSDTAGCSPAPPSAAARCARCRAPAAAARAAAARAGSTAGRSSKYSRSKRGDSRSKHRVGHPPDRAQRMVGRHALLRRQVTEHDARSAGRHHASARSLREGREHRSTTGSRCRSLGSHFFSTLLKTAKLQGVPANQRLQPTAAGAIMSRRG